MAEALRTRENIPEEYKWNLSHIFSGDEEWEKAFKEIEEMLKEAEKFRGKLSSGAEVVAECIEWSDQLSLKLEDLFGYARMKRDEDNRVAIYQAFTDRVTTLSVKASTALSFIVPELLAIPDERLKEYLNDPQLSVYKHYIENIIRQKAHVLSLQEERLLAEAGELADAPGTIFTMANDADLKFGSIGNEDGKEVEITKGNFIKFMESEERRVRKDAFTTLYDSYEKQVNTFAAMLNSSIKADCFYARVRKYNSAIEQALDADKIPLAVYESLIATVNDYLPVMERYLKLRKKVLGLDEIHMYDIYAPLVPEMNTHIPFEEAKSTVREGLQPLGGNYLKVLDEGYKSGWIDIYENVGKTSGAYSWGTYSSHPYVLLNHQDNLNSLFTLAHEMGHALHSYFSNKKQIHLYAGYTIFVAEVASTLNESLVMMHLIETTQDKTMKAYLINHYLEQFRGTIFRQTMFAEFEKNTHAAVERGESLTAESLTSMYQDLNKRYYGPDMNLDSEIGIEWARIPHFYNAFYVYKYATGFSAATALAQQILKEGEPAVNRYLDFLGSGGSDYPIELLRRAGVDMEKPEPVKEALDVFSQMVQELEKLLA